MGRGCADPQLAGQPGKASRSYLGQRGTLPGQGTLEVTALMSCSELGRCWGSPRDQPRSAVSGGGPAQGAGHSPVVWSSTPDPTARQGALERIQAEFHPDVD